MENISEGQFSLHLYTSFSLVFMEVQGIIPVMSDKSWGTPAALTLLVKIQQMLYLQKKKELETQLALANSLLDSQMQLLKKQNNGK